MKETKKNKTSFVIGVLMLIIAGSFIAFAMKHPEFSFPWYLRTTFMLYGVYIWFMFKFLIDIPIFRKNKEKKDKNKLRAVVFFIMAVGFFLMEITGESVDIYTIIRGFVIVGACDTAIENVQKNWR